MKSDLSETVNGLVESIKNRGFIFHIKLFAGSYWSSGVEEENYSNDSKDSSWNSKPVIDLNHINESNYNKDWPFDCIDDGQDKGMI